MSTLRPTTLQDRVQLSRFAGLCATCAHVQALRNARSCFARCALSDHDQRFPRYPVLPVVQCRGYQQCRGYEEATGLAISGEVPDPPAGRDS